MRLAALGPEVELGAGAQVLCLMVVEGDVT